MPIVISSQHCRVIFVFPIQAGLFSIFLEDIGLGPADRPLITNRELVKLWEPILGQSDKDPAIRCELLVVLL